MSEPDLSYRNASLQLRQTLTRRLMVPARFINGPTEDDRQQAAFIRAICESPHDDGPREMFADWLMERGDPRGEFIRVQLAIAHLEHRFALRVAGSLSLEPWEYTDEPKQQVKRLRQREQELLDWFWRQWAPSIGVEGREVCANLVGFNGGPRVEFRRGFVERVECRMQDWLDHGEQLVLTAPITEVRITDRVPYYNAAGVWLWIRDHQGYRALVTHNEGVPPEIFDHFDSGGSDLRTRSWIRFYGTAELAHADLSRAAVAWARDKARLPELE